MVQLYDQIGMGYANLRRPDPRLATRIFQALGEAETVVSVGAGTGRALPRDALRRGVPQGLPRRSRRQERALGEAGPLAGAAAVAKSPSAFPTHSRVSDFIEDFAFFHDLLQEEVVPFQALLHLEQPPLRSTPDQSRALCNSSCSARKVL